MLKIKFVCVLLLSLVVSPSFAKGWFGRKNNNVIVKLNESQEKFLQTVNLYISEIKKQIDDLEAIILTITFQPYEIPLYIGHLIFLEEKIEGLKSLQSSLELRYDDLDKFMNDRFPQF